MRIGDAIRHRADRKPDSVALKFKGAETTFATLAREIAGIAEYLKNSLQVKTGDRVAYLGLNDPHMVRLIFACAEIGAVFCPFNSRLAKAEYEFLLQDSEPTVLFHDHTFSETAHELALLVEQVVSIEALDKLESDVPQKPGDDGKQALLLVYTSGTTGRPKGVVLTEHAVWANIENGQSLYGFESGQTVLITLPLFHVGGMCILLLPALTHGSTIELHQRFDPAKALDALSRNNITTTILVPAQMAAIMALPVWKDMAFTTLKYIVVGSSVIPIEQINNWHGKGVPVSQIYGATETGPSAIGLRLEDCFDQEGSAGTALPLCEIEVRGPERQSLGTDEAGDIWVRGPNVMHSYWRNPEETSKVLVDGWYNTGDIGKRDDKGFFWIIDRSKDVIISGGENIYPAEVEAASMEHPAICAIALVGKPDPHWGETPVAIIETNGETVLTSADYLSFLQGRIARYKQPKSVIFLDALPRNGMGKIEKPILRRMVREEGS